MDESHDTLQLQGKLLIAMPGMGDPRFEGSVVFVCAHSGDETLGLIVNKPASGVSFRDMLEQLSIEPGPGCAEMGVHFGGPVETGRGFVLHSPDYGTEGSTLHVNDDFAMTATLDVLEALAGGGGPRQAMLMLGYAGWGPGQLEQELMQNGWLTCDATPDLVFAADDGAKWTQALATLGVDALTLSASAGRA